MNNEILFCGDMIKSTKWSEKKKSERKQKVHSWWWCLAASQFFCATLTSTGLIGDEMLPKCKVLEGYFWAYSSIYIYTECPRRKRQNFGRVFLMLKYTDITQNTYIQSWTVTEIMAREKCGLLACLRTVPCQLTAYRLSVPGCRVRLQKYRWRTYVITVLWLTAYHV